MNRVSRRTFIRGVVAAAVAASLSVITPRKLYLNAAYPPGDIRRYGAVPYFDCTAAFQAAIDDQTPRDIGIYVPAGKWPILGEVSGVLPGGHQIGIQYGGPTAS